MSWKSKAAALFGLAASVLIAYLALTSATGGSAAFAQVVEKLRSAQTMTYDWVSKRDSDGTILSRGRNLYMVPGKIRIEFNGEKDVQSYFVADMPTGKVLFVDAAQKTARIVPLKEFDGNDRAAKAIEDIRSLEEQGARPLGNKQIDGVQARGFAITRDGETTTVWANAASGDPIRVEILGKSNSGEPVLSVWTNIKLDQPLDPQLFSVRPPAGFAVSALAPADAKATPAHYVAEYLKIYAKYLDGQFPSRLQDAPKLLAEKFRSLQTDELPSADLMQLPFYTAATHAIMRKGRQGRDWQYFPGHKLGEKDQVVFWLRDRKNGEYAAVFGDLRIEKVGQDQLPPAPGR